MQSFFCQRPSTAQSPGGSSGASRMCCAIRYASPSSPVRLHRKKLTASATKPLCAGQRASMLSLLLLTRIKSTSITISITTQPHWIAPTSFVISSVRQEHCGGCQTKSAWKMRCLSLLLQASQPRPVRTLRCLGQEKACGAYCGYSGKACCRKGACL